MTASTLFLFDIDGTLTRRTGPHHKQALVKGIQSATGILTTLDGVPTQGMLDRDLVRAMLAAVGVQDPPFEEIFAAVQREYLANCADDLSHCVCPGVHSFLDQLRLRKIPLALVTGNLSAIGWKKIELAGLRRYFSHGAFSDQAETRPELAALAVRNAREAELVTKNCSVSLIGDHPNDVRAATANGYQSIGVATGFSTLDELRAAGAHIAVTELTELDATRL